ncbi:MAG: GCN5-related N-acetyltransferase [Frankiales bacterium]|nr:GCN5-related N-acetyltransferase [Frankiales bacterium]
MPLTRRPARPADAIELSEVYSAYDVVEFGEPEMTLADIESMLAVEGSDHVVVEADRIVGFADVAANGEVETLVDLSYDGAKDLQRELLAWAVQRAEERTIPRLEHWAGASPQSVGRLLAEAGFHEARTLWRMHRDLAEVLPEPVWPAGVTTRPFDLDRDGREVWNVVMTSFAGAFGSHPRPYEEWVLLALGGSYDVVCAVEAGTIVGVATTGPRGGTGHVGQLAVLPEERGRGLALALLYDCFRRDAALGFAETTLTVDGENSFARRLYEKAGMQVRKEYRRWERDV